MKQLDEYNIFNGIGKDGIPPKGYTISKLNFILFMTLNMIQDTGQDV